MKMAFHVRCPVCGEERRERLSRYGASAYPRFECETCGSWWEITASVLKRGKRAAGSPFWR